jgi:hypothetical protein
MRLFEAVNVNPCIRIFRQADVRLAGNDGEFKHLYQKYHSKGLQIISIPFDADSTDWKKAVRKEAFNPGLM